MHKGAGIVVLFVALVLSLVMECHYALLSSSKHTAPTFSAVALGNLDLVYMSLSMWRG